MNLDTLYKVIQDRHDHPKAGSYTNSLFEAGEDEILKKVGEEAMEVLLAGKGQGKQRQIEEISDLAYHTLVLMVSKGITPDDIRMELEKRHR